MSFLFLLPVGEIFGEDAGGEPLLLLGSNGLGSKITCQSSVMTCGSWVRLGVVAAGISEAGGGLGGLGLLGGRLADAGLAGGKE